MSSIRIDNSILNQRLTPAMYADQYALRPAAGFEGRLFIATDTKQIWRDRTTGWDLIADAGVGSGTLASVCANGNFTATDILMNTGTTLQTSNIQFNTDTRIPGGILFENATGNLSVNGTQFYWDYTNNRLGLGTATPGVKLDIHSGAGNIVQLNGTGTSNAYIQFQNAGSSKWTIGNNQSSGYFDLIDSVNSLSRLFVTNTGYVMAPGKLQVGSSTPSSSFTFDVTGTANISTSVTSGSFIKTGGTADQILAANGSIISAGTGINITGGTISSSAGMSIGGSITSATAGSVLFAGTSGVLQQNNTKFFWDNTNFRLGLGNNAPTTTLDITGSAKLSGNLSIGISSTYAQIAMNGISGSQIVMQVNSTTKNEIYNNSSGFVLYNNATSAVALSIPTTTANVLIGAVATDSGDGLQVQKRIAGNTGIVTYSTSSNSTPFTATVQTGVFCGWGSSGNYNGINFQGRYLTDMWIGLTPQGDDGLYIRNNTPTNLFKFSTSGVLTILSLAGSGSRTVTADANGVLSAASDSSLKQEDKEYNIAGLNEVLQLIPRAYKWLNDIENRGENATTEIGFFANEVAPIIPSAAPKSNDGLFGFYDRAIIAALVKSVQQLNDKLIKNNIN